MEYFANPAQEQAIETTEGHVCIIACPGSGKSTTMIRRAHHMVEDLSIPASSILLTTFSNMAAKDLAEKYKKMYGENPGIFFATLHSLCFNILRTEGLYNVQDILKENDKTEMLFQYLKNREKADNAWDLATKVANDITVVKSNQILLSDYQPVSIKKDAFIRIYNAYEAWKEERHLIDFDDMLIDAYECLVDGRRPHARQFWQDKFRYIVCDEYQDTNYIQRDILYALSETSGNLCVVGDDDQSIYRFRGARSEIMLNFGKDFPDCTFIRMGTNYRSGSVIVDFSTKLIGRNSVRFKKEFRSWRGEDSGFQGLMKYSINESREEEFANILSVIKEKHENGLPYNHMCILIRTNEQAGYPVEIFCRNDIPFFCTENVKSKYEGFIFLDLAAYVRLSAGCGNDRDFARILNHPSRFFKEKEFRGAEYSYAGLMQAASYLANEAWKFNAAEFAIEKWMLAFGPGVVSLSDSPKKAFEKLMLLDYRQYIKQYAEYRNLDEQEFLDQMKALKDEAAQFATIQEWFDFAEEDVLAFRERNKRKDINGVFISTFHKSKGKEYDIVFVTGVAKNGVPHKKAKTKEDLEEERRCFYVACTRAKNELYVSTGSKDTSFFMQGLVKADEDSQKQKERVSVDKLEDEEMYECYFAKKKVRGAFIVCKENGYVICMTSKKEFTKETMYKIVWESFVQDVLDEKIIILGKAR